MLLVAWTGNALILLAVFVLDLFPDDNRLLIAIGGILAWSVVCVWYTASRRSR